MQERVLLKYYRIYYSVSYAFILRLPNQFQRSNLGAYSNSIRHAVLTNRASSCLSHNIPGKVVYNNYYFFFAVDCGPPNPPTNGQIGNYSRTTEGADVNFTCDSGFIPVTEIVAVCESDGLWNPLPENHTCMDGMT